MKCLESMRVRQLLRIHLKQVAVLMRFRSTAIGLMSVMLVGASAPVAALPTVTIKSCYDGDTCTTTTGEKVRLACIDTPELKGENAKPAPAMAAMYHLNGMLMSQKVGIRRITTDRYGRTVAELFINGANVQQSMVASGHAELLAICQPVPVDALIPPSGGMQALHQSPDRVICPDLSRTRTVIEDLPEASASQSTSQITALSMTHPNNQSKAIASEP